MRIQSVLLAALAVAATGVNAQAYIQCGEGNILLALIQLLAGTVVGLLTGVTTNSACVSACKAAGWTFSYFAVGVSGVIAEGCYCTTDLFAPQAQYIDSASSGSTCQNFDYTTTILNTGFVFQNCYAAVTLTGTTTTAVSVLDPSTCFSNCAAYAYLKLTPVTASTAGFVTTNQYNCQCGSHANMGAAKTCGNNVPNLYKSSTVSATRKRREHLEMLRAKKRAATFCPETMTACHIPGSEQNYECIDPATELESCGGCTNGLFGTDDKAIPQIGEDCTQIRGAALGAVSCVKGQCQVYDCRPGWKLVGGRCVHTGGKHANVNATEPAFVVQ